MVGRRNSSIVVVRVRDMRAGKRILATTSRWRMGMFGGFGMGFVATVMCGDVKGEGGEGGWLGVLGGGCGAGGGGGVGRGGGGGGVCSSHLTDCASFFNRRMRCSVPDAA